MWLEKRFNELRRELRIMRLKMTKTRIAFALIFPLLITVGILYQYRFIEVEKAYYQTLLFLQSRELRKKFHIDTEQKDLVGYPENISFPEGNSLIFYIARNPGLSSSKLKSVEIFRIKDDTSVFQENISGKKAISQVCADYKENGCDFKTRIELNTNLTQGSYYAQFADESEGSSERIFFIILPNKLKKYDITIVYPNFTWNAYTRVGGASFYTSNSSRKYRLSLKRPIFYLGGPDETHGPYPTVLFEQRFWSLGYRVLPTLCRGRPRKKRLFRGAY